MASFARVLWLLLAAAARHALCDPGGRKATYEVNLSGVSEGVASTVSIFLFILISSFALQFIVAKVNDKIPISLILFVFGMAIHGTLMNFSESNLPRGIIRWLAGVRRIDNSVLYFIALPILLYEATQKIDWYSFCNFLPAGTGLAVIGVVLQVGILGVVFHYVLGTGERWSFSLSFLLASILSSTDPVSVLSILGDAKTPNKLITIFNGTPRSRAGESLINDGTSVLLFQFFYLLTIKQSSSSWYYVGLFIKLLVVSPVVGVACGTLVIVWASFFRRWPVTKSLTSIFVGYLLYFCAEYYLNISGPLTIVVYGIFMRAYGPMSLDSETLEKHEVLVQGLACVSDYAVFMVSGILTVGMMQSQFLVQKIGKCGDTRRPQDPQPIPGIPLPQRRADRHARLVQAAPGLHGVPNRRQGADAAHLGRTPRRHGARARTQTRERPANRPHNQRPALVLHQRKLDDHPRPTGLHLRRALQAAQPVPHEPAAARVPPEDHEARRGQLRGQDAGAQDALAIQEQRHRREGQPPGAEPAHTQVGQNGQTRAQAGRRQAPDAGRHRQTQGGRGTGGGGRGRGKHIPVQQRARAQQPDVPQARRTTRLQRRPRRGGPRGVRLRLPRGGLRRRGRDAARERAERRRRERRQRRQDAERAHHEAERKPRGQADRARRQPRARNLLQQGRALRDLLQRGALHVHRDVPEQVHPREVAALAPEHAQPRTRLLSQQAQQPRALGRRSSRAGLEPRDEGAHEAAPGRHPRTRREERREHERLRVRVVHTQTQHRADHEQEAELREGLSLLVHPRRPARVHRGARKAQQAPARKQQRARQGAQVGAAHAQRVVPEADRERQAPRIQHQEPRERQLLPVPARQDRSQDDQHQEGRHRRALLGRDAARRGPRPDRQHARVRALPRIAPGQLHQDRQVRRAQDLLRAHVQQEDVHLDQHHLAL